MVHRKAAPRQASGAQHSRDGGVAGGRRPRTRHGQQAGRGLIAEDLPAALSMVLKTYA